MHGVEGKAPYIFAFSNRYSVFDWGAMPDELAGKGAALATIADNLFRYFARQGLRHHSRGLINQSLAPVAPGAQSAWLAVDPVRVLRPREVKKNGALVFDYSAYAAKPVDALVPLEVIFRLGAPEGSSILARAENNPAYLADVGLTRAPRAGERFAKPVVEFSTKLEPTDRALTRAEAAEVAGLSAAELSALIELTGQLALRLEKVVQDFGAELWDGKFEFAFVAGAKGGDSREFALVDSIGPDELRILMQGAHLSKEALRRVYRDSDWYKAVGEAKAIAKREGTKEWKAICRDRLGQVPANLPPAAKRAATDLYPALANAFACATGATPAFPGARALSEVAKELKEMPRL